MTKALRIAFQPPSQPEVNDTGLRYTDILFGFVIRELFVRLQNWPRMDRAIHWQLIVATTVVLGSWIGFRRNLNRPAYQLKFFNLPFFRFLADQIMLILYFRIATLTPQDVPLASDATALAAHTLSLVFWIFALYVVWDLLGIWMARVQERGNDGTYKMKYPKVVPGAKGLEKGTEPQVQDWVSVMISGSVLLSLLLMRRLGANWFNARPTFAVLWSLLLIYRWLKELRTSWRY